MKDMQNNDVRTTSGQVFTEQQSAEMAHLVYLRFGRDEKAATNAWCRMLQNNCSVSLFMELVNYAREHGKEIS